MGHQIRSCLHHFGGWPGRERSVLLWGQESNRSPQFSCPHCTSQRYWVRWTARRAIQPHRTTNQQNTGRFFKENSLLQQFHSTQRALNAAFIKNVNEVVVCWNTKPAVKRNKTRNYFFENLLDSFVVRVLTLGGKMRKLLGVHQHYSNLWHKNWNFLCGDFHDLWRCWSYIHTQSGGLQWFISADNCSLALPCVYCGGLYPDFSLLCQPLFMLLSPAEV